MPSKPPADPSPISGPIELPQFRFLQLAGPDAADFLQRQTMNDVRALGGPGQWHWNGLLSPKGRLLWLFALLRSGEDAFTAILPATLLSDSAADQAVDALAGQLRRSLFRSKLQIGSLADWRAIGLPGSAPQPQQARAEPHAGGWLLDFGSSQRPRQLWIGGEPFPAIGVGQASGDASSWLAEDLRHGLPQLTPALRDAFTPQMLGLGRLAAYSVKKGCYPGQEIVARTHFLGQAKRELALLAGQRPFADGERLRGDGGEAPVLQQVSLGDAHLALAVLPVDPADARWQRDDGSTVERIAFVDGLARRPE
jgi:tRNA-modifying protein YgfZ